MRYNTPIFFQSITPGEYDTETGNYGNDILTETKRYADVTSASVETLHLVYGEIRKGSYTVRLQNRYNMPFDSIRIGNKKYHVDYSRPLKVKQVFVVSEV